MGCNVTCYDKRSAVEANCLIRLNVPQMRSSLVILRQLRRGGTPRLPDPRLGIPSNFPPDPKQTITALKIWYWPVSTPSGLVRNGSGSVRILQPQPRNGSEHSALHLFPSFVKARAISRRPITLTLKRPLLDSLDIASKLIESVVSLQYLNFGLRVGAQDLSNDFGMNIGHRIPDKAASVGGLSVIFVLPSHFRRGGQQAVINRGNDGWRWHN
jgi:hypothetical protein